MTSFILKLIAIIGMTSNHIAHVFSEQLPDWLYYILMPLGGLTFPIMAYLMNQGYHYSRNFKRYLGRLFIFAVISLAPFIIAFNYFALNILFTLALGLIIIHLDKHMQNRICFYLIFIASIILSGVFDWGFIGVPMMLLYHRYEDNKKEQIWRPLLCIWIFSLIQGVVGVILSDIDFPIRENIAQLLYAFVGSTATIPILLKHNGKQGPKLKYFFYAYYPAHLTLLIAIRYICE